MVKTLAPTAARSLPIDLDGQFDEFLDALRREQMSFLDSMRTICMPLGSANGALATAATGQARLTQQFLDAQRSLLRRTAEFDSAAIGIRRSAAEDARQMVLGAANYALDCGVPSEELEAFRWSALDAACRDDDHTEHATEVARRQQHELSALLDRWWAETQQRGTSLVEGANVYAGTVRGRADDRVAEILEAVARHTAPHSGEAPVDGASLLPVEVLAALETADQSDLGGLLDSLLQSLVTPTAGGVRPDGSEPDGVVVQEAPTPAEPLSTASLIDSLLAEVVESDDVTGELERPVAIGTVASVALPSDDDAALIQLGQRATEHTLLGSIVAADPAAAQPAYYEAEEPYGLLAVFTRVLLPMGLSIAAAVALLAWLG